MSRIHYLYKQPLQTVQVSSPPRLTHVEVLTIMLLLQNVMPHINEKVRK